MTPRKRAAENGSEKGKTVAKDIVSAETQRAVAKYEAPSRVETSLPPNAVTTESLCNGGDIVLRGVGRTFKTNTGDATPVYFQHIDDYEKDGPIPLEMAYTEDGKPYLTGKSDDAHSDDDGTPVHVYQFLTGSIIILRAARSVTEQPNAGLTARITTKVSISTGNTYYTLE